MTGTDYPDVRMVCLGRVFRDGRLYVKFVKEGEDHDQAGMWPLAKTTRRYQLGGIYNVPLHAAGSSAKFSTDPWKDMVGRLEPDETAALRIASEAAEAQLRAFKTSKKVGEAQEVLDVLEPLRRIYRSSDRVNRRLIELTVIDYLRKP